MKAALVGAERRAAPPGPPGDRPRARPGRGRRAASSTSPPSCARTASSTSASPRPPPASPSPASSTPTGASPPTRPTSAGATYPCATCSPTRLGGVPVALGHDVRTGGLAEGRIGAGKGADRFLFVPLGTGIAGAIGIAGRVEAGAHGFAGEIGHIVVRPGRHPVPVRPARLPGAVRLRGGGQRGLGDGFGRPRRGRGGLREGRRVRRPERRSGLAGAPWTPWPTAWSPHSPCWTPAP